MFYLRASAMASFAQLRSSVRGAVSTAAPHHLATADAPSTSSAPLGSDVSAVNGVSSQQPPPTMPSIPQPEHPELSGERNAQRTMPRRIRQKYTIPRGIALPPPSDPMLSYFTNLIMKDGKRHQAARQVAETLNNIHIITRSPPLPILREAVERASPEVKVVSQRRRHKNVMTPRPLTAKQRTGQAIRWIIQFSEGRQEYKFEQRLAKEIVAIVNNSSDVLKKKDEVHKLTLANRCVWSSVRGAVTDLLSLR